MAEEFTDEEQCMYADILADAPPKVAAVLEQTAASRDIPLSIIFERLHTVNPDQQYKRIIELTPTPPMHTGTLNGNIALMPRQSMRAGTEGAAQVFMSPAIDSRGFTSLKPAEPRASFWTPSAIEKLMSPDGQCTHGVCITCLKESSDRFKPCDCECHQRGRGVRTRPNN